MSQNDFIIADAVGSIVRADINSALQALASQSTGATAPATTYPFQMWSDTTANLLKMRNAANSGWMVLAAINSTSGQLEPKADVINALTTAGLIVKDSTGVAILTIGPSSVSASKPIGAPGFVPTTQSKGDILVSSGTGSLGQVPVGADGDILIADSAASEGVKWGSGSGVLQIANTSTSAVVTVNSSIPSDDSIPQSTEGIQVLSLSFTPKSSTSKVAVEFICSGSPDTTYAVLSVALFDGGTGAIAAAGQQVGGSATRTSLSISHVLSSWGTTTKTISIRIGADTGFFYVNGTTAGTRIYGGVASTLLKITEIE